MTSDHLPFERLSELAGGETSAADEDLHLTACDECRDTIAIIRRFEASWEGFDSNTAIAASADVETRNVVHDFKQRLADEDADAYAFLHSLLAADGARFALGIGRYGARYRTGGMVRALCGAARAALAESPLKALILADEAIEIARELPDDTYPSGHVNLLRGNAWKERANALRLQGTSYPEALAAVDEAERAYRRLPEPELYLGMCDYVRATIYARRDCPEDAVNHARRAGAVFSKFRDMPRYRNARTVEALALFDVGRFRDAHGLFIELHAAAEMANDAVAEAHGLVNLATVELELGLASEASARLVAAIRQLEAGRLQTDAVHARSVLARVPLREGKPLQAIELLRKSLAEATACGLSSLEAGITLDLVEAHALLGRTSEVMRLCASLVRTFMTRGQLTSAMTAFAFLRDEAARGTVTPAAIHHVRRFLRRLEAQPTLLFDRPPTDIA